MSSGSFGADDGATRPTVCPGDNVGPILSPHHKDGGPWQHLIERMLEGHCEIFQGTGPYRPWMTVDVRDDAACHIGILASDKVANGELGKKSGKGFYDWAE